MPQLPVCARHTVQDAKLARRRLRLTPEVNSGYLPAVGRAPDVARGPRALKDGLPGYSPPFALAPRIIFPFTLSCRAAQPHGRIRGARGELFLPLSFPEERAGPFAQDTLYGLRNLHDGHCV